MFSIFFSLEYISANSENISAISDLLKNLHTSQFQNSEYEFEIDLLRLYILNPYLGN